MIKTSITPYQASFSQKCPLSSAPTQAANLDLGTSVVAVLLTTHALVLSQASQQTQSSKTKKVRRLTFMLGGTAKDKAYFQTRWSEYKQTT